MNHLSSPEQYRFVIIDNSQHLEKLFVNATKTIDMTSDQDDELTGVGRGGSSIADTSKMKLNQSKVEMRASKLLSQHNSCTLIEILTIQSQVKANLSGCTKKSQINAPYGSYRDTYFEPLNQRFIQIKHSMMIYNGVKSYVCTFRDVTDLFQIKFMEQQNDELNLTQSMMSHTFQKLSTHIKDACFKVLKESNLA